MTRYNPEAAINFSVPVNRAQIGQFGPYPSRPCGKCGYDDFSAVDFNLGYACNDCGTTFGTPEEWDYWE